MKCGYSREILALYIEDDLPTVEAMAKVRRHVSGCADCRQYCEQLQKSQSWIRARVRPPCREAVSSEKLSGVRRAVMAQIRDTEQHLGWVVKLERMFMMGFRRQRYAAAGFAVVAILSASLLGQIKHSRPEAAMPAAVFVASNTLARPAAYREWVFVGSSGHNVYIDPAAYREYGKSGKFPEGTVMVLEMVSAEASGEVKNEHGALQVSVKDSGRFEDGWGYFDFTAAGGNLRSEAEPIPQSAGCVSCHRDKAATDHVFTQFYPVLKSARS